MSGGSYNYSYCTVEEHYVGRMHDVELNEMMSDLVEVLHDVEWWQSSDISEEDYRKTVSDFKKKWFKRSPVKVKEFIEKEFTNKKEELLKQLNYLESEEERW